MAKGGASRRKKKMVKTGNPRALIGAILTGLLAAFLVKECTGEGAQGGTCYFDIECMQASGIN